MSCLRSYKSSKIEVRNSDRIGGKGLFAKSFITKGEVIAVKGGYVLTLEEYDSLGSVPKPFCLQIDDELFLGPRVEAEVEESAIFINHSCEPNVGFDGQIIFLALRDIERGEELFLDYAMSFFCRNIDFKCNCGAKCCRRVISDNDWKLKELQAKYGNKFAHFILKKIYSE